MKKVFFAKLKFLFAQFHNMSWIWSNSFLLNHSFSKIANTVKPVYNDHPRDPKIVSVVDRWSLFRGHLCNKNSKWNTKMMGRFWQVGVRYLKVAVVDRWSFTPVWLYYETDYLNVLSSNIIINVSTANDEGNLYVLNWNFIFHLLFLQHDKARTFPDCFPRKERGLERADDDSRGT